MECSTEEEGIQFISTTLQEQPIILYCTDAYKLLVAHAGIPYKELSDVNDDQMRTLDSKIDDDNHQLIIITEEFYMRGFDFRAPNKGIVLIIAKPFTHDRALI